MDAYRIIGGRKLQGTVAVSGSKNTALPIMAASLLVDGPVHLTNVPDVVDVSTLAAVLGRLGVAVERSEVDDERRSRMRLLADHNAQHVAPNHLVSRMRASFCVLGPLLARRGRAVVALPGGCNLGDRPVDLHLKGLAALGAEIQIQRGYVVARAKRLRGAEIQLAGVHGSTVTGTANVMMAATLAEGTTTIRGAAVEPEVVELGRYLSQLGANIEGMGTPTISVRGVSQLSGTNYEIAPDRIETATLLLAVAITGGDVTVTSARPDHLESVLKLFRTFGAEVSHDESALRLRMPQRPRPFHFVAEPYPGIPTDLQPLMLALSCIADGSSTIEDRVFPVRWRHAGELRRMGAHVHVDRCHSTIDGVERLVGASVRSMDLRGGAALVLAGLAAQGETVVTNVAHIDRGYERFAQKLGHLGADIERVAVNSEYREPSHPTTRSRQVRERLADA